MPWFPTLFPIIIHTLFVTIIVLIYNSISVAMVCECGGHRIKTFNGFQLKSSTATSYNSKNSSELGTEKKLNHSSISLLDFLEEQKNKKLCSYSNIPEKHLSRAKRYIAFPEGSSFTTSVCITVGIIGNPSFDYMSFGLNWGLAYDLPNTTWILDRMQNLKRRTTPIVEDWYQRRSRRSFFEEIERALNNMGFNGPNCILRLLCESRYGFRTFKRSMIGKMMKMILNHFGRIYESKAFLAYDRANRYTSKGKTCSDYYNCTFFLMEQASGKYTS